MAINMDYVVYLGFFKLLEFIFSLISWSLFAAIYNGKWSVAEGREEFLLALSIIVWIFSAVWFTFNIWLKNRPFGSLMHLVFAVVHLVLGITVLAAGSWATNYGMMFDDYIDGGASVSAGANGIVLVANYEKYKSGAAFGMITGIVFIVDAMAHAVVGNIVYASDEMKSENADHKEADNVA